MHIYVEWNTFLIESSYVYGCKLLTISGDSLLCSWKPWLAGAHSLCMNLKDVEGNIFHITAHALYRNVNSFQH